MVGSGVVEFGVTLTRMVEKALFSSRSESAFSFASDKTQNAMNIICAKRVCITRI